MSAPRLVRLLVCKLLYHFEHRHQQRSKGRRLGGDTASEALGVGNEFVNTAGPALLPPAGGEEVGLRCVCERMKTLHAFPKSLGKEGAMGFEVGHHARKGQTAACEQFLRLAMHGAVAVCCLLCTANHVAISRRHLGPALALDFGRGAHTICSRTRLCGDWTESGTLG